MIAEALLLALFATSTSALSLYDFVVADARGIDVPLTSFADARVAIVVNVASE